VIAELVISFFVLVGGFFTLVGSIGLVRLQDVYSRLHGPTKATTLGVGGVLWASLIYFGTSGDGISLHELLIAIFLFITAPVSAHLLAKTALHLRLHSTAAVPGAPRTRTDEGATTPQG
jgi:multicomponent K+:H+ antiporter subunit G